MFNKLNKKSNKGFTLIELMVSISVFAIVMVICMGAIVMVLDANRKSQTLRSVMDNLNSAMEVMTRDIRFGYDYHCGSSGNLSLPTDCPFNNADGSDTLVITDSQNIRTTYFLYSGKVVRISDGDSQYYPITSPDVTIQSLNFKVYGSYPSSGGFTNDLKQPKVVILIKGYSGTKPSIQTSFTLQTTVSQRKFDFQ